MKTKYILLSLCILLCSCGVEYIVLEDGRTKIPENPAYFIKKLGAENILKKAPNIKDYSIYAEDYYLDSQGWHRKHNNGYYSTLIIYENGNVVSYIVKDGEEINKSINLNVSGRRGVLYIDNNELHLARYTQIAEMGGHGIDEKKIAIKKDSLIIYEFNDILRFYKKIDVTLEDRNITW